MKQSFTLLFVLNIALIFTSRDVRAQTQPRAKDGPSFSCAKAATLVEKLICSNADLSRADRTMVDAYVRANNLSPGNKTLRQEQDSWRVTVRDVCKDSECLSSAYAQRIAQLMKVTADAQPQRIGECVSTRIFGVGTRLQGAPNSGSWVGFDNGLTQVGYDMVPAIDESRKGDPVQICLVSVPKDCPKGDDRGRVYETTNLRTRKSWTRPDASHMCGGA